MTQIESTMIFCPHSAARSKQEYELVRDALRLAIRARVEHPEGKYGLDRRIVTTLLDHGTKFRPRTSPFTCYLTDEEWGAVSRMLRRYRAVNREHPCPEYVVAQRAWMR